MLEEVNHNLEKAEVLFLGNNALMIVAVISQLAWPNLRGSKATRAEVTAAHFGSKQDCNTPS